MRETATSMVFTLAELITPEAGEIGWGEGNVRINHPYLRRVAKLAQTRQLAVGFVHSHPRALPPRPSKVSVVRTFGTGRGVNRSEEHTSELQSLMRISYDVLC